MTRVCLYTRISTDEENQPTSLHSQRERLHAFCNSQDGWRIVAHEEDRASGTKLDRPGLQRALALARSGDVDLLLCYRVDRLSRKVRQLAQLAEELDSYGCVLRSATEPFDTGSAAGRMMLQMLAVFAEFEHATIVDRVTAGIERRAKEGRWTSGRIPFGYRRNEQKRLVPDEREAPVVRRLFQLYVRERLGTVTIARRLAAEGARRRPRAGSRTSSASCSETGPPSGRCAGAARACPACISRSSTRRPSPARRPSSTSAARTVPPARQRLRLPPLGRPSLRS